MLPFTSAFWSLRVFRVPGEKDDNLGLVCVHMPAAAMNITGLYSRNEHSFVLCMPGLPV